MVLLIRTLVIIALVLIGTIEIWMIYGPLPKVHASDESKLTSHGESPIYAEMLEIGMFTAPLIRERNIKAPMSQKDLAQLIIIGQLKNQFIPGVLFGVDNNGFLVDLNNKTKYKVYSDGIQVIVAPQPKGTAIHEPIYPAQRSE